MTGPAGAETATIQATIDGREVTVPAGTTILDAARDLGIDIPTLCHHETLSPAASCRLCVVEVEGRPNLMPACATELARRHGPPDRVPGGGRGAQAHPRPAPLRPPAGLHHLRAVGRAARLQDYCYRYGVEASSFEGEQHELPIESDNPMIERDMNKCILCGKCVRVCQEVQVTDAIEFTERGFDVPGRRARSTTRSTSRLLPLLRPVRRHLPHRRPHQQAAQGRAHLGPREGAHHLPLLRRRLQLRPQRRRRQGGRRQRRLRRAGQPGLAVRQGPLPHRPHLQPGPHHHAAHQEGRRVGARHLGRGARPRRRAAARIRGEHGTDAIGVLSSARCTNEENYLLQRLTRAGLNTNTIDHCART